MPRCAGPRGVRIVGRTADRQGRGRAPFEAYERSTEASAARTAAHDDVKVLFAALARNAGAIAVAMEPRGWDAGGATDRHKRPDIECINV